MNLELVFQTEDEVMFYDTDCGGVVHNLAYLRMIEACRTKLGAKLGWIIKPWVTSSNSPWWCATKSTTFGRPFWGIRL